MAGRTSRKTDDGIGRVVVWSDQHFPYHDERAHEAIYAFAKDTNPDVHLHIGDCLNLGGISRHVQDDLIQQYEEPVLEGLLSFGRHINHLCETSPESEIIWIWGNHEERLRAFVRKHPSWRGIIDDPLGLLEYFGKVKDARKIIRLVILDDSTDDYKIGKMHYCHGFSACKHTAAKHVEDYGESVTFGHSHTMQLFTAVRRSKPIAGYCVGHLMSKEGRRYLKGRPHRWVTGFGYMEYLKRTGQYTMHLLPIIDGKFIYGKVYG